MSYDLELRHALVRSGAWVGFPLAFRNRGGIKYPGLTDEPRRRWRPWHLDPTKPEDPAAGHWGVWQWRLHVLCADHLTDHSGKLFTDARTGYEMRQDLYSYHDLPAIQFKDVDAVQYDARLIAYTEELIAPYDTPNSTGAWLLTIDLAQVTIGAPP